jgi:phosphoribosylformylglycinamidine synthase subunit PurS
MAIQFKTFSNLAGLKLFKATVIVKRRPSILDPQGKAVEQGAKLLGFNNISKTRIDKYIEFIVNVDNKTDAEKEIKEYSIKLLSNPIMEDFEYNLEEIK